MSTHIDSGTDGDSPVRHLRLQVELVLEITDTGELRSAALDQIAGDEYLPDEEREHARDAVQRDEAEAVAYLVDPFDLVSDGAWGRTRFRRPGTARTSTTTRTTRNGTSTRTPTDRRGIRRGIPAGIAMTIAVRGDWLRPGRDSSQSDSGRIRLLVTYVLP